MAVSNLKVHPAKKPANLSVKAWQTKLREQIATKEKFKITNISGGVGYSDYNVSSTTGFSSYKVAIRSADTSANFCSCLDFKTNKLGTCKHIEAVMNVLAKKRSAVAALRKPYQPEYTSVYISYKESPVVKIRVGTLKNTSFTKLASRYFDKELCLKASSIEHFGDFMRSAKKIDASFRCYPDVIEHAVTIRENRSREIAVNQFFRNKKEIQKLVKCNLFPYQLEGVRFCATAGRSILADDMGLGKTVQAIATAQLLRKITKIDSVFIICPTSLKHQWATEIKKFAGESALVIEGNVLAREKLYASPAFYKILSYNVTLNDWKTINDKNPGLLLLDEAQRLKNFRAKVSQRVKLISSRFSLVLTGTPIENNLEELYSLMQLVNPLFLGSLQNFLSKYRLTDNETGKVTGYTGLNTLGETLRQVMLRRRKKEVLSQLPERSDRNLLIPMTEKQTELHDDYALTVSRLVRSWRRKGFLEERERQRLMIALNLMRMSCDSTYLIDQETNHQNKIDELVTLLSEILSNEGEKVVIFSQWERMTRLVRHELELLQIGYRYLHGAIPSKQRGALYSDFNEKSDVRVFLSTDAGGVGLNLQSAAWIINLDIPWNPGVLEQRIGRIHRLGQKKPVNVINLVSANTIESNMLGVIGFKKSVAAGVLDDGDDVVFMGESRFKKFMESVETITAKLPTPATDADTTDQELAIQPNLDYAEKQNEHTLINGQSSEQTDNIVSNLLTALSDEKLLAAVVKRMVQVDKATGAQYLKIPVESETTVVNALKGLAKLLGGEK